MSGVEILASSEVVVEAAFNWSVFGWWFAGIVAFALVLGIILSLTTKDWSHLFAFVFSGALTGVIFAAMFGKLTEIPLTYATQHKVTISDEVQLNDFLEKYEIVSKEGKIYTVIERPQE